MATIKLRDSTILGDFNKPYIVAEINTSHFGDIELARKMIDQAKYVGCDCVKFQSWSAETLYSSASICRVGFLDSSFNQRRWMMLRLRSSSEFNASRNCN